MLSARLAALFAEYSANHVNVVNVRLHKVAIPLIVFHLVAMLDWVRLVAIPGTNAHVTLAHVAYVAVVIWYLGLDVPLGLCMAVLMALCFPLGWVAPWPAVVAVAVLAWGLQLAGHAVWEKRQPAFLHNLRHALVGPVYFVATGLRLWPPRARDDFRA